jgi:hemerythrin HHE cation binding domain-containing protein
MEGAETLSDEHREIRALLDRLDAYLASGESPDPVPFLHFRRDFGRTVTLYLKKADWTLYPRLKASSRPELRAAAMRLCSEIGALEEAFGAYARRWTSSRIAHDWAGYRQETAAMIRLLDRRMLLEEQELFPLLGDGGALRLAS